MGEYDEETAKIIQEAILRIVNVQGVTTIGRLHELTKAQLMRSFDRALDDLEKDQKINIKGCHVTFNREKR